MFVGTMKKIYDELNQKGIKSHLIYGQTPKEDRVGLIDDFRSGDAQVLISNPATLGSLFHFIKLSMMQFTLSIILT